MLLECDPQSISKACQWVEGVEARGLTDILSPYQVATGMLLDAEQKQTQSTKKPTLSTSNIPVIFLITDGAVVNEREICGYAQQQAEECQKRNPSKKTIRTFTYGIGPFVNQFFLKSLASKGRGYSHICLNESRIETTMIELMNKSNNPLLVNVSLQIPSSAGVQHVSPAISPDLYQGVVLI